jgi:lipoyl-dependent peroxiredoxin
MTGSAAKPRFTVFNDPSLDWLGTLFALVVQQRRFNHRSINLHQESQMKIQRKGSAAWRGGMKDGKGEISLESGAMKSYPYGFTSRFEGQKGSNPEELIAAAHASCFTMALSLILGEANLVAEQLETSATVSLEKVESGYSITEVHLVLKATIPGADQQTFEDLANKAKANCPVSKVLNAKITLDAALT